MLPLILEVPKVAADQSCPAFQSITSIPRLRLSTSQCGSWEFPSLLTVTLDKLLAISKPWFHHLQNKRVIPTSYAIYED